MTGECDKGRLFALFSFIPAHFFSILWLMMMTVVCKIELRRWLKSKLFFFFEKKMNDLFIVFNTHKLHK